MSSQATSFTDWTLAVRLKMKELKKQHATREDAWYALYDLLLLYVGQCSDEVKAKQALDITKTIAADIPVRESDKKQKLASPVTQNLNLETLIDRARKGYRRKPNEV